MLEVGGFHTGCLVTKRCTAHGRRVICPARPGAGNLFRARARWDFPEQLVGQSHKRKHHNDFVYIRPLQYFYCKAGKSVRRLVLLAMEKYVNVRLDGWARQQKNVIEMTVRVQGAKEKLRVLHLGQELFATVGAAKHGYDALNVRNNLVSILENSWKRSRAMSPKKGRGK